MIKILNTIVITGLLLLSVPTQANSLDENSKAKTESAVVVAWFGKSIAMDANSWYGNSLLGVRKAKPYKTAKEEKEKANKIEKKANKMEEKAKKMKGKKAKKMKKKAKKIKGNVEFLRAIAKAIKKKAKKKAVKEAVEKEKEKAKKAKKRKEKAKKKSKK
jgi:hypothetical protein